jgi:hypothetical protein
MEMPSHVKATIRHRVRALKAALCVMLRLIIFKLTGTTWFYTIIVIPERLQVVWFAHCPRSCMNAGLRGTRILVIVFSWGRRVFRRGGAYLPALSWREM